MGFDSIIEGALKALMSQGSGWVVAVLLFVAIIVLSKKNDKMQALLDGARMASEASLKDQFEKRLAEFRPIIEAINRSSDALTTMKASVDARTDAINQIVAGFANIVRELDSNRDREAEKGKELSAKLEDIRGRLENLQNRRAS